MRFSRAIVAHSRFGSKVNSFPERVVSSPDNQYIPEVPKAVPNSTTTLGFLRSTSQVNRQPIRADVRTSLAVRTAPSWPYPGHNGFAPNLCVAAVRASIRLACAARRGLKLSAGRFEASHDEGSYL